VIDLILSFSYRVVAVRVSSTRHIFILVNCYVPFLDWYSDFFRLPIKLLIATNIAYIIFKRL